MAMDSMLCRFKATYPAERIDSVRSLLEDKERQMFQISAKLLIFSKKSGIPSVSGDTPNLL